MGRISVGITRLRYAGALRVEIVGPGAGLRPHLDREVKVTGLWPYPLCQQLEETISGPVVVDLEDFSHLGNLSVQLSSGEAVPSPGIPANKSIMARWTAAAFSSAVRWMCRALQWSVVELDFVKLIEEQVREAGSHLDTDDVVNGKIGFHDLNWAIA
jgi:hypothetical protein